MVAANKSNGLLALAALIPAVAYLRMSSKKQDKSIKSQRAEVEKFAAANGYRIVREYVDEGISGAESEKREAFRRLIKDAQERKDFRAILCWDQDRFSRFDPMEANYYWYILREVGVEIVTVAQGRLNFEDLAGWLAASVNQYGKAQFLRDLSRNTVRGKHKALREGKWIGRPPYGYAKDEDLRLVIGDRDHVKVVKWIYQQYAETDTSARAIQLALIARGTPGPAGDPWTSRTVLNVLKNPVYKGQAISNRQNKGKFFVIRDGDVKPAEQNGTLKPKSDWIINECPAVVSPETWDIVQAKLVQRQHRTTPKIGGGDYLLSGLVYCGHCGSRMTATKFKGRNSYVCSSYQKFGLSHCNANSVAENVLTDYLVETIVTRMTEPANMKALKGEIRRQMDAKRDDGPGDPARVDPARVRRELKKLEGEIQETLRELRRTPDDIYDLVVDDLRKLRESRDALTKQIKAKERRQGDPEAIANHVAGRLQALRQTLRKAEPAVAREAMRQFCSRIDLFFTHTKRGKLTQSRLEKGILKFQLAPPHVTGTISPCFVVEGVSM